MPNGISARKAAFYAVAWLTLATIFSSCSTTEAAEPVVPSSVATTTAEPSTTTTTGPVVASPEELLAEQLVGKNVGLITNQTSLLDGEHRADVWARSNELNLVRLFSPEHGIRGEALAGEAVPNLTDSITGLEVVSLYGTTRKPPASSLSDIDVLVFDIQDVGSRFYTFIATMGLAMEAAAENDIPFFVIDKPNPQGGNYIAGFTRESELESFIAPYPIPSVYGLTIGELALAIKGEAWAPGLAELNLTIVELQDWSRDDTADSWPTDWVAPSPALPTAETARAYPGIVLFEATNLFYGRGTDMPFLMVTGDGLDGEAISAELNSRRLPGVAFTAIDGGVSLNITDDSVYESVEVGVHMLDVFHRNSPAGIINRPQVFDQLAGSPNIRQSLEAGAEPSEIIESWASDVQAFSELTRKYHLY